MKGLLLLLSIILLLSPTIVHSYMLLPIVEVYDGDTIKTDLKRMPVPLNKVSIRIYGIDTPEMPAKSYATTGKLGRAKCVKEAALAIEAKEFVEWLAQGFTKMKVDNFKWDKYGGRILGDVSINGVDVAESLIDAELAVAYFGSGTKKDWCQ